MAKGGRLREPTGSEIAYTNHRSIVARCYHSFYSANQFLYGRYLHMSLR
jgi:hypothetical protein